MKWKDDRLVSIVDYHYEGDKKIVDEVTPIRPIKGKDANKEFFLGKRGNDGLSYK